MNLDALHDWLSRYGRATVIDMMRDLNGDGDEPGLRKLNPGKYDDLPDNGITCQQWLERLEADGRAVRDGSFWRWAPGREKSPAEKQGSLFG